VIPTLEVRRIQASDEARLIAFHAGLSTDTKYRRFLSYHPTLAADEVHRFTHVDGADRVALVALQDDAIIAVARYDRLDTIADSADVAFVVTDAWQGEGLGTVLLKCLTNIALTHGIERFTADTLTTNIGMMRVFRATGFPLTVTHDHGVSHVEFPITPPVTPSDWKDVVHAYWDHHSLADDAAQRACDVGGISHLV